VQDKKRILKFVRHYHPPFPGGGQAAVQALRDLAGRYRRLLPRSMLVRQFLALVILYGAVVVNVEKIPGHWDEMHQAASGSLAFVRHRTDGANAPTLFLIGRYPKAKVERIAMSIRRRFKQVTSLKDRLAQEAESLRKQAQEMPPGVRRDELLRKAREAETAARVDDWLASPGLQPPK
jgi:hypothetical protein